MAALPAGRIAAGNMAGIEVLALEADSSGLAPEGVTCQQERAEKIMVVER